MNLGTNAYFAMGKSHTVCQDYAATGINVLALSDGCSSSPHTDFGSRFLVQSALQLPGLEIEKNLEMAAKAISILGLPDTSLDATLLWANVVDGKVNVRVYGDGLVWFRYKNGETFFWDYSFSGNAPAYPSYLANPRKLERYLAMNQERKTFVGSLNTSFEEKVTAENFPSGRFSVDLSDLDSLMLISDGVHSFRRMTPEGSTVPVPVEEVLAQVTGIKSPLGAFMVRRMRKFLGEFCPKNGWVHDDDVSVAALMVTE